MKLALLVIDVQKAYFNPDSTKSLENAIEYINAAIELFRTKGLPVICIQHRDDENNHVPGVAGFDLPESLKILPSDLHIHKTYGNSFNKTPLLEELKKLGVDTVLITGFRAEGCVLSTYRGALDVDLTPILLRGSIAGPSKAVRFVESISNIISYGVLENMLA
ncbi:MAG: isochorismatase family protein [Anaerolineaceae bacterium]